MHYKPNYQFDMEIANWWSSNSKCNNNETDILLYVKDSVSFAFLLDQTKWLSKIPGGNYCFSSTSFIPPQLSLIIKNVDLRIDFDVFSDEIIHLYPDI
jgi:hypothetical protein